MLEPLAIGKLDLEGGRQRREQDEEEQRKDRA